MMMKALLFWLGSLLIGNRFCCFDDDLDLMIVAGTLWFWRFGYLVGYSIEGLTGFLF